MLTEEQIAALRPLWNDYPERRVVVPRYPEPRKRRGARIDTGEPPQPEELTAIPAGTMGGGATARLWSVSIFSNVAGASIQRGSPAFIGPALIHSFTGMIAGQPIAGVVHPAQLAYSTTPYADTDVGASGAKLPGTHIATTSDPYANTAQTVRHSEGFSPTLNTVMAYVPFGIYVDLERFYIGLLIEGTAGAQSAWVGILRVIENAPPESIAWV